MQLKASAPGSLMLLGEYAVLQGKQALVCAIDKRITVTLTQRNDEHINVSSVTHGNYATTISELTIEKPFQFVLGGLKQLQPKLRRGVDIHITSDFSNKIGLGSSAAVTVATLAALISSLNIRISPLELVRQARQVIRTVQGTGSGADAAASVFGGMVSYQAQPLIAEKLAPIHPLTVLYAGFKTTTVDAIKHVQQQFTAYPHLFRALQDSIGHCAHEGIQMVRKGQWTKLGDIMTIQQGIMESLGVSLPVLRDLIDDLRKQPTIVGAKISGSGLGDCVVGLGETVSDYQYIGAHPGVQRISAAMTMQGVLCEKI